MKKMLGRLMSLVFQREQDNWKRLAAQAISAFTFERVRHVRWCSRVDLAKPTGDN